MLLCAGVKNIFCQSLYFKHTTHTQIMLAEAGMLNSMTFCILDVQRPAIFALLIKPQSEI